ncbi:MAG: sulfite exporter TauE/SafE family protein, partial [Myxococcales bacterium]|nr:sulfite exporter TauE/SafE family protein [Myxococcales bacterium]
MSALLVGIVGASLAGSVHCAGMCGGFVALAAGGAAPTAPRRWLPQLGYHAGRLVAYLALGTAAGALGSAVALAGDTAGIADAAPVLAGATMVALGG